MVPVRAAGSTGIPKQLSGTGVFSGSSEHLDVIKQHLPSHGEAGEGLLLAVF